jgi:hypothetical protein
MSKQLTTTHSQAQNLSTIESRLSMDKIANEQSKTDCIFYIGMLLKRLSILYQIPNWTEDNQEILAEWIYDNYKFNQMDVITSCLKNPPVKEKVWRLTPDVVSDWMTEFLLQASIKLEQDHERKKLIEKNLQPSESTSEFYKKNFFEFENNILKQPEKSKDQAFEEFKGKYISEKIAKDQIDKQGMA